MSVLFILIIASISVAGGFLAAFIWSVRNDQFEDRQGSAMRMLHDYEEHKDNHISNPTE